MKRYSTDNEGNLHQGSTCISDRRNVASPGHRFQILPDTAELKLWAQSNANACPSSRILRDCAQGKNEETSLNDPVVLRDFYSRQVTERLPEELRKRPQYTWKRNHGVTA